MSQSIRIGFRFKCRQCGEVFRNFDSNFPIQEGETITSAMREMGDSYKKEWTVHDCSHGAGKLVGIAVFVGLERIEE